MNRLNKGWKLDAVREAAYSALNKVGKDKMHFRPASEMNSHKVTCGVAVNSLETVLEHIKTFLKANDAEFQAIVSGKGDWRFCDLVPTAAGKFAALEYATREVFGFERDHVVACGDSGNDKDMLGGPHRGIVVGNAHEELMTWVKEQGVDGVVMVGGERAYGILEGLERLGFK